MKRVISLLTAVFMILSFAGCGKKNTLTGSVWQYSYAGIEHDYLEAISEYLVAYDAENLEIADGMIPCITSVEVDNEDDKNIKLWGIFDIYNYAVSGDTLIEKNGKRLLGMFILDGRKSGHARIKKATFAEEGDAKAIEKLCDGHEMAARGLTHPVVTEETRRFFIAEFAKKNNLNVTKYQPQGKDAMTISYEKAQSPDWVKDLPEAKETDVLIVLDATIGSNAVLTMHEKTADGIWEQTLDDAAFIGKNGMGKTMEGDTKTPLGTFGFNAALGINDDPGSVLPYTKVNDSHYWDCDSNSKCYNTLVSTDNYQDFNTEDSEHIVDYPNAYKYILNTTYNEECTPGKGSAIFLHCYREQRTYTGGCISIPFESMEYVLTHISPDSKIIIRESSL